MRIPKHCRGQIVDTEHSDGLSIRHYWAMLFDENERAFRSKQMQDVLTDEQLVTAMHGAFPKRNRKYKSFDDVRRARARFNRGVLTSGSSPRLRSWRYTRRLSASWRERKQSGMYFVRRATSHGTPINKLRKGKLHE